MDNNNATVILKHRVNDLEKICKELMLNQAIDNRNLGALNNDATIWTKKIVSLEKTVKALTKANKKLALSCIFLSIAGLLTSYDIYRTQKDIHDLKVRMTKLEVRVAELGNKVDAMEPSEEAKF